MGAGFDGVVQPCTSIALFYRIYYHLGDGLVSFPMHLLELNTSTKELIE